MKTRLVFISVAVIGLIALLFWVGTRHGSSLPGQKREVHSLAELSEGERNIQRLVREVHGPAIISEKLVRVEGGFKFELNLDTNKTTHPLVLNTNKTPHVSGTITASINKVSFNLTVLAQRQKEEGLSDAAVKAGVALPITQ